MTEVTVLPAGGGGGQPIVVGGDVSVSQVNVAEITDATALGRSLLKAADQATARAAIGASDFSGAYADLVGAPEGIWHPSLAQPAYVDPSLILSQFQAGHGFTNNAGSTLVANDTSDFVLGTQSCKITTGGTGATATLSKLAGTAFDTTGQNIRLRLKVDNIDHMAGLNLFLGWSSLSANYKWIIQGGKAGSNLVTSGEWVTITLNWHDAVVTGSVARSGLTDIRISVSDDNTGNPVTLHAQSIELIPVSTAFPNGIVSICFDDEWQDAYTLGKPKMDQYGYRGSLYVIADMVNGNNRLSMAELQNLQAQGWEISAHAMTDADHSLTDTGMTGAQFDADALAQREWLTANGFRGQGHAYPLGQYGLTADGQPTRDILQRYFAYGRTTYSRVKETVPPGDPYRLRGVSAISSFAGANPASSLTAATTGDLDKTKANGTWLILIFHEIVTTVPTSNSQCLQSDFNAIVDAINAKGIPVLPVADVLRKVG